MNRTRASFIALASLVVIALPTSVSASDPSSPVIFNYSSIAKAGDVVNLQGYAFGDKPEVWCSTNGATAEKLATINSGNNVVHAKLPSRQGLYDIQVRNGALESDIVHINRARPWHFDTNVVEAGGQFRIFGRNLSLSNFRPTVILVSGNHSYKAATDSYSSDSILAVRVPLKIPPGKYSVQVSNGLGNQSQSSALADSILTIIAKGSDRFKLGVPWADDFSSCRNIYNVRSDKRLAVHALGNGSNNEQAAIQQAINLAAANGGGTIFLPSGTYKIENTSGPLLELKPNVVLRGAGKDSTTINFGYGKAAPNSCLLLLYKTDNCGICDLALENVSQNNDWLQAKTITAPSPCNSFFLARVKADLKDAFRIDLKGDRISVTDCQLASHYTLLFMASCTNSRVSNNTLTQTLGVNLDVTHSANCLVENNKFILDANKGAIENGNVRHGLAIDFAHNLAIVNNQWSVTNGQATLNNDGEAILSEGGANIRSAEETGQIVTSSEIARCQLNKNGDWVAGSAIAIISGSGVGQWRQVTGRSGHTVELGSPWTVRPDASSNYAIFCWSNQNTTITGNSFNGWPRGIWLYQASTTDTQIGHNRLTHMDGIFIEPCQNASRDKGQFNVVWNTTIDHNWLSSGKVATYINITGDLQQTTKLQGTLALNNQIYKNSIKRNGSKVFANDPAQFEGFCNYLRVEAAPYGDQERLANAPALLGTIFQSNIVHDNSAKSRKSAYLINGGCYQTSIITKQFDTRLKSLVDSNYYWNTPGSHNSVSTIIRK